MKQVVTLVDYGRAEYLDGAMMRFTVCDGEYPGGNVLGYFWQEEHAKAFAKWYAKKKRCKMVKVCSP